MWGGKPLTQEYKRGAFYILCHLSSHRHPELSTSALFTPSHTHQNTPSKWELPLSCQGEGTSWGGGKGGWGPLAATLLSLSTMNPKGGCTTWGPFPSLFPVPLLTHPDLQSTSSTLFAPSLAICWLPRPSSSAGSLYQELLISPWEMMPRP